MKKSLFVSHIMALQEDKGAMAALRRGLGKRLEDPVMYRYVVPFLPDSKKDEWIYFTVASLFGRHHKIDSGISIGDALGQIKSNDSLEKRFVWLLDSDKEDLPLRLKSIISLLESKDIGIDYQQLFHDLKYWDHPKRFVQLNWARGFYQRQSDSEKNKEEL